MRLRSSSSDLSVFRILTKVGGDSQPLWVSNDLHLSINLTVNTPCVNNRTSICYKMTDPLSQVPPYMRGQLSQRKAEYYERHLDDLANGRERAEEIMIDFLT